MAVENLHKSNYLENISEKQEQQVSVYREPGGVLIFRANT